MSGFYFNTSDDANDWLDFEADDEERERYSYTQNDRYEEWVRWQELWEKSLTAGDK